MLEDKSFSVNISGYLQAELGVGEVGRIIARAADHAVISYSTLTSTRTLNRQNFGFEERTSGESSLINLIAVNADQMKIWAQDVGAEVVEGHYNIGVWSWELEDFPEIFDEAFNFVDEIWAISEFTQRAIAKRTDKPVFAVPLHVEAIDLAAIEELDRAPLGILPNDQYFLFMFDFMSDLDRKNPLGLIEAFKSAFLPNVGPKLFIKSINGGVRSEDLEKIRQASDNRTDIIIFDGYLDKSQRTALIAGCTAYVSLHRSEGYGLTMAEAMSLSKPVIATAYSANCEFMSSDDSLLIPFELVSTKGNPTYPFDSYWAAPSTEIAAEAMRKVFADRVFAQEMGRKALKAHLVNSSVEVTSRFMIKRLSEIVVSTNNENERSLAIPAGSLEELIGETGDVQLRIDQLFNRADALSHTLFNNDQPGRNGVTSRLARKIVGRLLRSFEQFSLTRHQAQLDIDVALRLEISQISQRVEVISECYQDSRSRIDDLSNQLDSLRYQFAVLASQIRAVPYMNNSDSLKVDLVEVETLGFGFKDQPNSSLSPTALFRPERDSMISSLRNYSEFMPTFGMGIDLGCGRGEMLQVLVERGLDHHGVDSDKDCVEICKAFGFSAEHSDISKFLTKQDSNSTSFVSMIHVIEHVDFATLQMWLGEIFRILKNDGVLILATPNPYAVDAFKAFWVDPTHVRPYYPEAILRELHSCGFRSGHVEVEGLQKSVHDRLEYAGEYSVIAKK